MTAISPVIVRLAQIANAPRSAAIVERLPPEWSHAFHAAETMQAEMERRTKNQRYFGAASAIQAIYALSRWYLSLPDSDRAAVDRMIEPESRGGI